MKKISAIFLIFCLTLSPVTVAAEEENSSSQKENATENQLIHQQLPIDWQQMNEMQIALAMINRQIEYLMEQIENDDDRVEAVIVSYEKRLDKERERSEESIAQLNEKLVEKQQQLEEVRKEIVGLNKKMALFTSENSVYLITYNSYIFLDLSQIAFQLFHLVS